VYLQILCLVFLSAMIGALHAWRAITSVSSASTFYYLLFWDAKKLSVCNTEWLWLMFCAGHGKSQMSSVMQSESEVSSEEETIFMNQRKPNGVAGGNVSVRRKPVTNGSTKAGTKTKVSA